MPRHAPSFLSIAAMAGELPTLLGWLPVTRADGGRDVVGRPVDRLRDRARRVVQLGRDLGPGQALQHLWREARAGDDVRVADVDERDAPLRGRTWPGARSPPPSASAGSGTRRRPVGWSPPRPAGSRRRGWSRSTRRTTGSACSGRRRSSTNASPTGSRTSRTATARRRGPIARRRSTGSTRRRRR